MCSGGDVQVYGRTAQNQLWTVGICHPFKLDQIVKRVALDDRGIATSGSYLRGAHILTRTVRLRWISL